MVDEDRAEIQPLVPPTPVPPAGEDRDVASLLFRCAILNTVMAVWLLLMAIIPGWVTVMLVATQSDLASNWYILVTFGIVLAGAVRHFWIRATLEQRPLRTWHAAMVTPVAVVLLLLLLWGGIALSENRLTENIFAFPEMMMLFYQILIILPLIVYAILASFSLAILLRPQVRKAFFNSDSGHIHG
jgi:hypothetical protein